MVPTLGGYADPATRRDLRFAIASISFGMLYTVVTAFPGISPLMTAYLRRWGLDDVSYGLIMAIPQMAVLVQVPYSRWIARIGRTKTVFLLMASIPKLMFLPLGLLPLLFPSLPAAVILPVLSLVILLGSASMWIADMALQTWLGALVPNHLKGRFFGTRQMGMTFAMVLYGLLLSALLVWIRDDAVRYAVLFGAAALVGWIDVLLYAWIRPPERAHSPGAVRDLSREGGMKSLLRPLRDPGYGRYLGVVLFWSLGINLTGPYFNLYMMEHLSLPIGTMNVLVQIIPSIATVLFIRKVGAVLDRHGIRSALVLCLVLSSLFPVCWLFVTVRTTWLIAPMNFIAGVVNPAVELSLLSLAIFLAPDAHRPRFLMARTLVAALLGAIPGLLAGGLIAQHLAPVLDAAAIPFLLGQQLHPFHVQLVLSFLFRFLAGACFARRLPEEGMQSVAGLVRSILSGLASSFRPAARSTSRPK